MPDLNPAGETPVPNWVVNAETNEIVGPCGCHYPHTEQGHAEAAKHEHEMAFLLVIDCTAVLDETGMLPLTQVLETVRQALAPVRDIKVGTVHTSIRESREEILHAIEAVSDEEDRRRG